MRLNTTSANVAYGCRWARLRRWRAVDRRLHFWLQFEAVPTRPGKLTAKDEDQG